MQQIAKPCARIIDAHAHIFPNKIAKKASNAIGAFYDIPMADNGEPERLLQSGNQIGVDRYLVCSSATTPAQVVHINDFIAEQCALHPSFYGFGTLHPDYAQFEAEADRMLALGLHGVKLHPDFQRFNIDDAHAIAMYRACAARKLPILFHTGDDRYDFSSPLRLANAMDQVPDMVAIAAHFGGYRCWDMTLACLRQRPNVYFDTSSTLFSLDRPKALEMLYALGIDRFFFGTDHPMWDHAGELARFLSLNLPRSEQDAIFYQNFERVFQLD